ncbi:MAG: ComEC/Rec2 family competence protein, partial [Burkholderiales bacterium]
MSNLRFDTAPEGTAFTCGLAALLALVAAIGSALQHDAPAATGAIVLGAWLSGLSLGATAAERAYRPPLLHWFEQASRVDPIVLEGELREDAAPTASGISLTIDVTSVNDLAFHATALGGVRVSVGGALTQSLAGDWRAGRTVRVPALLRRPSTYFNPGSPDERRALARRGIVLVGAVKSGALVELVRKGSVVAEAAAAIRAATRARVRRLMEPLDPATAGVTTAVLVGDRSGLGEEDERRLQEAGTYHVIAISGGNIAVLAFMIVAALRVTMVPARTGAVLTGLALMPYGTVAAGAPSVSRAVTVAIVVLAARALDHRGSPLNALAVASLLAAAWSPVVALDPGFVLSFGATLGILLGVPRLQVTRPI